MTVEGSQLFDELCGAQLSAVTFVQDYLQLWFDGPGINVINPLTVHSNASTVTSWQPGFRDAICAQIAKVVTSVKFLPNEAFTIQFTDGSLVSVSLIPTASTATEALYAHGFRQDGWFVA